MREDQKIFCEKCSYAGSFSEFWYEQVVGSSDSKGDVVRSSLNCPNCGKDNLVKYDNDITLQLTDKLEMLREERADFQERNKDGSKQLLSKAWSRDTAKIGELEHEIRTEMRKIERAYE